MADPRGIVCGSSSSSCQTCGLFTICLTPELLQQQVPLLLPNMEYLKSTWNVFYAYLGLGTIVKGNALLFPLYGHLSHKKLIINKGWELYNFSNITWLMFAIVRAFVGLILMKNTHAPVSCISFVSVMNTLGFVLMLVACAPPGPSLTCSTVIKIVKKKLVYFVMLRLNIHYKPNLFGKVHSFPIID